jgi:S1-C subfamily serine protease
MAPEEAGDEDASGPPPHPLDRPWVHPSELAGRRPPPRASRPRHTREWLIALGAGVVGALVMVVVLAAAGLLDEGGDTAPRRAAADGPADAETDTAARLAAAAGQSVVGIIVATPMGPRRASGVYVRNGEVVTTAHAVEGAGELTVVGADGSRRPGTVVGQDESTRLALVRVDGDGPPAKLAANAELEVGQWILALGGTDGTGSWVAEGVVAALGGFAYDGSGKKTAGMITVDTVIPPEARGGALLNRQGHVVGLLAGPTADDTGGLVTRIASVRAVAAQLSEDGRAAHGALGVHVVDEDRPRGARVAAVTADSAADRAGVSTDDVVIEIDGAPVRNAADLVAAVQLRQPDDRVQIVVMRRAKPRQMAVVLGTAPAVDAEEPMTNVSTAG